MILARLCLCAAVVLASTAAAALASADGCEEVAPVASEPPTVVTFAADSAELAGSEKRRLLADLGGGRLPAEARICVLGQTDDVGDRAYNEALARRRAEAVANVLENAGLPPARIEIDVEEAGSPGIFEFERRVEVIVLQPPSAAPAAVAPAKAGE